MYHDEFMRQPAKFSSHTRESRPSLPFEVGGGVSLGLAASLNQPISMVLFYLGGLLPLFACSVEIATHQVVEFLRSLAPSSKTTQSSPIPMPHLSTSFARKAGATRTQQRARASR